MKPSLDLIVTEALAFVLAWITTFALGARVKRGHWMLSILLCAAVQSGAWSIARALGVAPSPPWTWGVVALISLVVIASNEPWNAFGHAAFSATLVLGLAYIFYVASLTIASHLGPASLVFSAILGVLQAAAYLLLVAGSWEILDATCRREWRRRYRPGSAAGYVPRVSLHIPAYNEPPDMVIETLDAVARLDYANFEVIVIDDNTKDEAIWRPVEAHCSRLGFRFYHLDNWPGFKSGALNFALRETDPAAEIVGVIDSDYVVRSDYLRQCVGFFASQNVAFVQTPQDYRAVPENDRYSLACYDAYRYFFAVSMPSRNEHNGIIFAGTMGLIRRQVLESLGGWDEWCITEDAEVSLRILDRGYEGVFLEDSFGHGLMPLSFEGLKKQRFRWAFGGMQILRKHWRALLPWRPIREDARLSFAQRWDYLIGGLQWLNDPLTFLFTFLLIVGATSLLTAHSIFLQPLAPAVLFVPFLFIFIGIARYLWAFRVRTGLSLGRALNSFTILLGLTWVVTLACMLGLTQREGVFLRTPKKTARIDTFHAFRVVMDESAIAAICVGLAVWLVVQPIHAAYVWAMTGLLIWQASIYGSASVCSWWSLESERLSTARPYPESSRSSGLRFRLMMREGRASMAALAVVLLLVGLFVAAVRLAPETERLFRAPVLSPARVATEWTAAPDPVQVRAVVFSEGRAALHGDIESALALWEPGGVIRDLRNTPRDSADDIVWHGLGQIRLRYEKEFSERRYQSLAHEAASVVVEGDHAVVVNDLRADIQTSFGRQQVFLSRGDRWTMKRGPDGWRIAELILNRSDR
jgi:cellulose synthase/poly-beta-1,6-N-acetylglucosamine synthase-like glycosyltransferase